MLYGTKDNNTEADVINWCLFDNTENLCSSEFGKVKNMKKVCRLLFKILIGCLIPKEGSTYHISWDHKHFIFYLKNKDKINLSAYIFNHLCEAFKDSTKLRKKNVPYARLFYQGCLIYALRNLPDNRDLKKIYGNILFASVMANMKLMKKSDITASKIPFVVRSTNSDYLEDYPIITEMDKPEVIKNFII